MLADFSLLDIQAVDVNFFTVGARITNAYASDPSSKGMEIAAAVTPMDTSSAIALIVVASVLLVIVGSIAIDDEDLGPDKPRYAVLSSMLVCEVAELAAECLQPHFHLWTDRVCLRRR